MERLRHASPAMDFVVIFIVNIIVYASPAMVSGNGLEMKIVWIHGGACVYCFA